MKIKKIFIVSIPLLMVLFLFIQISFSAALRKENAKDQSEITTESKNTNKSLKSEKGMLLAVMDFIGEGVSKTLASQISEMVRNSLINKGVYTVVERAQVELILKEQGFQMSGCTDTTCAVKVGKLLSAKKMLVGKVIKLGTSIIISGRVVDVESGVGEAAYNAKATNEEDLFNAVNSFVDNIK
jgi:curli biogenesis system outer membrane secretion channel CsgG